MKNIAIVLAGGRGARMNSDIPKQYMDVAGKPLLYYSLAAFQQSFIDEIIIVCRKDDIDYVKNDIAGRYSIDKVTGIVHGGAQRYDSVYNGLMIQRPVNAVYLEFLDNLAGAGFDFVQKGIVLNPFLIGLPLLFAFQIPFDDKSFGRIVPIGRIDV